MNDTQDGDGLKETIRQVVSETLDGLFKAGKADVSESSRGRASAGRTESQSASSGGNATDISGQIERAVEKARQGEKRDGELAAALKKLDELEQREKAREKPPVEHRGLTKFLWGGE